MNVMRIAAAAILACGLSACATVVRGTSTDFTVESTPPDATVKMPDGVTCQTPCTVKMKRKKPFQVTVSKEGYKKVTRQVQSQFASDGGTAMAGNILIGGIIGLAVDATSGATNDLSPNPLRVTLEPKDAAGTE